MKLWDFAVAVYAREAVREACLSLQDESGHCVSLLLWAAWTAGENRELDPALLACAVAAARRWEGDVIGPLRAARRSLRAAGHTALAERVGATEIEAERLLLEELEGLNSTPTPFAIDPYTTLAAVASAWAPATSPETLTPLARALG